MSYGDRNTPSGSVGRRLRRPSSTRSVGATPASPAFRDQRAALVDNQHYTEEAIGHISQPPGSPWLTDTRALTLLATLVTLAVGNRLVFDAWLTRLDLFTFFLPWYHFLGEQLRTLSVPGWNPHIFSGAPFAGDPESGWMYLPAMLLFALLPAIAAFKAMVGVQIAIAALSTYALTRVLGMGPPACLTAATVYMAGPFLQWNTYCCLIFGQFATWIPLALLGIELALRAERWRPRIAAWCLGGLAVSQMLGGWAGEGWLYAVLLPAAYAGYRGILDPPRSGPALGARLVSGATTAFAVPFLGLALGAAGILPRLVVNAETNLAGGDYSRLGEAGVLNPPWRLDYLLVQILGEGTNYHVRAVAPGGAVVILFALALLLTGRRFAVPFFAALTLTVWLLTLETTPLHHLFYLIPRYREFHDHDSWRTIAMSAIGPAILAGAAIEALPRWAGQRRLLPIVMLPLLLLAIAAVALARVEAFLGWPPLIAATVSTALVAFVVATGRPIGAVAGEGRTSNATSEGFVDSPGCPKAPLPAHRAGYPLGGGWGEGTRGEFAPPPLGREQGTMWTPRATQASPLRTSRRNRGAPNGDARRAGVVVNRPVHVVSLLILAVIFIQPTGLELTGSWFGWPRSAYWEPRWRPDPAAAAALREATSTSDPGGAGEFLQSRLAADGPFRFAGYAGFGYGEDPATAPSYMARRFDPAVEAILVNGRPIFLGLYDVQGYNPLQLARYVEFMTALNGAPQDYHTAFLLPAGLDSPLLDLLDVRYLVIDAALPVDRADIRALRAQAREVFRTPLVAVYERAPAPRRAWIVHNVRQVARGEALPLLTSGTIDPFQIAFVEGTPPAVEESIAGADDAARVIGYEPDRVVIAARAASPGLLVVSEVYESGWRAFVGGAEAPIFPTDHALRGVPLPAGEHTVELHYDPWFLRLGLAISGVTAALMLVSFAAALWPRHPRAPSPAT